MVNIIFFLLCSYIIIYLNTISNYSEKLYIFKAKVKFQG